MARALLAATALLGSQASAGVAITYTTGDAINGHKLTSTGKEVLIAKNTGAVARTVTVTSAPDQMGRTKDIAAESIAAGAERVFGPFSQLGWQQTDGTIYVDVSHAEVLLAVLTLP